MRKTPALLLLFASTGAAAADPPKPNCPAPQAETVHLYLKANGTDAPVTKDDGACVSSSAGETARTTAGGKDCTGPRGTPIKTSASQNGQTLKHAINSKGTGTSGRAAAPCPAPVESPAPAK